VYDEPQRIAGWEWAAVALAAACALVLGFGNLDAPSLWHDELVHVFVGKSIADTGLPALPSGTPYWSGTVFNYVLGVFISLFGDGEAAVRAPSVLIAALNVVLTFLVTRPILGRGPALIAAFAVALSPWTVAWSRQARFYPLQQALYLATMGVAWRAFSKHRLRDMAPFAAAFIAFYLLSIATAFHSILFLGPVGVYALAMFLWYPEQRKRWFIVGAFIGAVGVITFIGYYFTLPQADRDAIFSMGAIRGDLGEQKYQTNVWPVRDDPRFYINWLRYNHSIGFMILAAVGIAAALRDRGRAALFMAIALLVPIVALSELLDYRRPRFMFFAFPFYLAFAAYGIHRLGRFIATSRESWPRALASVFVLLFVLRVALSAALLIGDSIDTASGDHITLARRHPQWRAPATYVRENLDGHAVVSTTYLPALYYAGRCDATFPTRMIVWEWNEGNQAQLAGVDDLRAFIADHPQGYFLADWQRFGRWPQLKSEKDYVREHMRRVPDVSNQDITLYRWGGP